MIVTSFVRKALAICFAPSYPSLLCVKYNVVSDYVKKL